MAVIFDRGFDTANFYGRIIRMLAKTPSVVKCPDELMTVAKSPFLEMMRIRFLAVSIIIPRDVTTLNRANRE